METKPCEVCKQEMNIRNKQQKLRKYCSKCSQKINKLRSKVNNNKDPEIKARRQLELDLFLNGE